MKKNIFNKIILSAAVVTMGFTMSGCTDLDETIYSQIASEKHEFTVLTLKQPSHLSIVDFDVWGWFGMADIMDESWMFGVLTVLVSVGVTCMFHAQASVEFRNRPFQVNWDNNYAGVNACNKILANEQVDNPSVDVRRFALTEHCIITICLICTVIFLWIPRSFMMLDGCQTKLIHRLHIILLRRN